MKKLVKIEMKSLSSTKGCVIDNQNTAGRFEVCFGYWDNSGFNVSTTTPKDYKTLKSAEKAAFKKIADLEKIA